MKKSITILTGLLAVILCACSGSESHKVKGDGEGWTVKGTIKNGADSVLYVESSTFNNWYAVDSLVVDDEGTFSYTEAQPDTIGSIYRLRMGKSYIFFPVNGKETIELEADAKNFGINYKLKGSPAAESFAKADELLKASIDKKGVDGTIADKDLRHTLNVMINQDSTCLLSYYLLNKRIGPDYVPYYNLVDPADLRTLGNVANNFARLRPNDPRTKELETLFLNAKREVNKRLGRGTVIEVDPSVAMSRPSVKLAFYDANGTMQDFENVVGKGKAVVLNFTRFDTKASPANTLALSKAVEKYGKNLAVYQIAFDPDEISWRHQAMKLPWTAVWATPDQRAEAMIAYNVNPIEGAPVSFIFDKEGQLVKRVVSPEELDAAIAAVQ